MNHLRSGFNLFLLGIGIFNMIVGVYLTISAVGFWCYWGIWSMVIGGFVVRCYLKPTKFKENR